MTEYTTATWLIRGTLVVGMLAACACSTSNSTSPSPTGRAGSHPPKSAVSPGVAGGTIPTPARSVSQAFVYPSNRHPDLLATAYRRSLGAGGAALQVRLTGSGNLIFAATGKLDLSHRQSRLVSVRGVRAFESLDINGVIYQRALRRNAPSDRESWSVLDLTRGHGRRNLSDLALPALTTAPAEAIEYIGRLKTPTRRALLKFRGGQECEGYATKADKRGEAGSGTNISIGVCLDAAGRLKRIKYAFNDDATRNRVEIHVYRYGTPVTLKVPTHGLHPI